MTAEQTVSVPPDVGEDAEELQKADLLKQFYLTLRVTYAATDRVAGSAFHDFLDRLFTEPHSWRNAYEIEQLLCFILTEPQLETELSRRLAEAKVQKLEYVDVIDKELHDPAGAAVTASEKRIILHRLLNDLQWFYTKRNQHRSMGNRLMWRVSALFGYAWILLFLVLFLQFFAHHPLTAVQATPSAPAADAAATPTAAPSTPAPATPTPASSASAPATPSATTPARGK
jgi:hypothetical protein